MMEFQLQEEHKKIYSKFYDKIISKHVNRSLLAKKFNKFITQIDTYDEDLSKTRSKISDIKKTTNLEVSNELTSLRTTNSSSKNVLEISRSRSIRSHSSRQKSENQSRFFGVDWVYTSSNQSRVYVFAILAAFIINDSSAIFYKLQDRINDFLSENTQAIPPVLMLSVNKYWQRVVQIVTKKKSYLWQKNLKQPIERMPLQFNKLIAKIVAGQQFENHGFNSQEISILSKQGKIKITNFVINYKQIEKVETEGNYSNQIIIGYLKHSEEYVIANKVPQYSDLQLKHRKAKAFIKSNVQDLIRQYKNDEKELNLQGTSIQNEKDKVVKQFFSKKLAILKAN